MYKNILIAIDGSALATRALDHGLALAKSESAACTVITVTELWSAVEMSQQVSVGTPDPIGEYEKMAAASAQTILDMASTMATEVGVTIRTLHVPDKAPAEGIVTTATQLGADLIVMASHGRRGMKRLILGSKANEVLALAHVPVLIVR